MSEMSTVIRLFKRKKEEPVRTTTKLYLGRKTCNPYDSSDTDKGGGVKYDEEEEEDFLDSDEPEHFPYGSEKIESNDLFELASILIEKSSNINHILHQLSRSQIQLETSTYSEPEVVSTPPESIQYHRRLQFQQQSRPSSTHLQFDQPGKFCGVQPPSFQNRPLFKKRTKTEPIDMTKTVNSSTIWNNTQKFFNVTPTVELFLKHLTPVDPPSLEVEIGPHYSDIINKKLKAKFKTSSISVRLPASFVDTSCDTFSESSAPLVFHRLLASLVPVKSTFQLSNTNVPHVENVGQITIPDLGPGITPTNIAGNSPYSRLSFEKKISIEINSLGFDATGPRPDFTDNEIYRDFIQKGQEYTGSVAKTNELRQVLFNRLKAKEHELIELAEEQKQLIKIMPKPAPPKTITRVPLKRERSTAEPVSPPQNDVELS